jgi:hypothetical protein
MKIRPVGAKLFHADGQMDTELTKLIAALSTFPNAPKNEQSLLGRMLSRYEIL